MPGRWLTKLRAQRQPALEKLPSRYKLYPLGYYLGSGNENSKNELGSPFLKDQEFVQALKE
jgi:hypothetical protein